MRFPDRLSRLRPIAARLGPAVGIAAALLALPLALFAGVTLGGRTMVPFDALRSDPVYRRAIEAAGVDHTQNGLVADLVYQNVVWKGHLQRGLEDGDPPLWSPYIAGGMPFLAAGQHSALYPTSLLLLFMRPDRALGWGALVNLWLAAACMYVLGRALGLGRFAAALMGLAWSASSLFVANAVFPMIQAGMTWLPIILAGITVVTAPYASPRGAGGAGAPPALPGVRALGWLVGIALATLLAALAGHPEIFYYDALVAAAYAAFRLALAARRQGWAAGARLGVWLAAAGGVGVLMAAVQLVPLAELAGVNWRGGPSPTPGSPTRPSGSARPSPSSYRTSSATPPTTASRPSRAGGWPWPTMRSGARPMAPRTTSRPRATSPSSCCSWRRSGWPAGAGGAPRGSSPASRWCR